MEYYKYKNKTISEHFTFLFISMRSRICFISWVLLLNVIITTLTSKPEQFDSVTHNQVYLASSFM